jgi:hypothetical protein
MQRTFLGAIAATFLAACGPVAASCCVLPVPDGGDIDPSPASLVGELVSAEPEEVFVRSEGAAEPVRIFVSARTELFTVYGGGIESQDLRPGQHVLIWLENCAAPERGSRVAAVLQVCSLAPEPCPK